MTKSDPAIEISGLSKWFGDFKVLDSINLEVLSGEIVVVCGPSGSGKSTLVRCINRLEDHDYGTIKVIGQKLTSDPRSFRSISSKVGMVFQQFNLFPHLSVLENQPSGLFKL